jgi:hypothetical protein
MPRYYFDTNIGARMIRDDEGINLPDGTSLRDAALLAVTELAREIAPEDGTPWAITVTVRDDTKQLVFRTMLAMSSEIERNALASC